MMFSAFDFMFNIVFILFLGVFIIVAVTVAVTALRGLRQNKGEDSSPSPDSRPAGPEQRRELRCPYCGAPVHKDDEKCAYCDTKL